MGKKAFMPFFALVILSFTLLYISMSSFAYAEEYYADLTIDIQNDGAVKITGITNDLSLSPGTYQQFTSKKGMYWLLNVSSDKTFSDYILSVKLPEGVEFNYLKTNGRSRVSYDNGIKIVASGTGSLNLLVQYRIDNSKKSILSFWLIIAVIGVLIIGFFLSRKISKNIILKRKSASEKKKEVEEEKNLIMAKSVSKEKEKKTHESDGYEKIRVIKETLAESQEKIINLLLDAGGELVQKQLQHRSGLAKATLSRNIDVLSRKGLIIKQSRGMTNMIKLKKDVKKE